jgi:translation initiation factor 1
MAKRRDAKVVYSSGEGDLRKRLSAQARGETPVPSASDKVRVRRETTGRRGKAVTTVTGLPLPAEGLRELAGRLKRRCGVGGAVKDGVIELQGDHRDLVVELLRAEGHVVVQEPVGKSSPGRR